VDALGHIYVVDRANFRIEKFDDNGTLITAWGSPGTSNGQLNHTHGIAVYPCGNNLYVPDTDNNRIQMFDSHGMFLRKWGSTGTATGQFRYPEGIGVDSRQGNVYVADTYNNRIQLFDDYGKFITTWGSLATANGQVNHPKGIRLTNWGVSTLWIPAITVLKNLTAMERSLRHGVHLTPVTGNSLKLQMLLSA
jgi:tripartite motif-containing protein 71